MAKIYSENCESQCSVVLTEAASSWISWRIRVRTEVTQAWVTTLTKHAMRVLLWNTKDKLKTEKAKTDKPKRFKMLEGAKATMEEGMKQAICEVGVAYSF